MSSEQKTADTFGSGIELESSSNDSPYAQFSTKPKSTSNGDEVEIVEHHIESIVLGGGEPAISLTDLKWIRDGESNTNINSLCQEVREK